MKERFKLTYLLPDYGKLLFEFDGDLNSLDASKEKRKAMLRSPVFYFLMSMVLLLVCWFLASLISNSIKYGFGVTILGHLSGGFALFVMCLILCLSAFGGWGKMIRFSNGGTKLGNIKEFAESEREADLINERKRDVIAIYEQYLVITNFGWTKAYYLDKVAKVILESTASAEVKDDKVIRIGGKAKTQYTAKFISYDGEVAESFVVIPNEKTILIQLKKIFGDKLEFVGNSKKAVLRRNKSIGSLVGLTLFLMIPIAVGIGVIFMHYKITPSVPVALGVFFICGGLIGLCGVYDFVPVLKDIFVPILFGAVFLFFPISIMKVSYASHNIALTAKTFFSYFTVFGAAVVFFGGLGLMCVYVGIKNAIDYIRYRDRKAK